MSEAMEQIQHEFGPATALAYAMFTLAGLRQEEELVKHADKLDRLVSRITSAPPVIQALNQRTPAEPSELFDAQIPLLIAVRDQIWQLKPDRVSTEFLLTQVVGAHLGEKAGGGNSLGLAVLDAIIIGKMGFPVRFLLEDGILSLEVELAGRSVFWDLTHPQPLSLVSVTHGRTLDNTELLALTYGSMATLCFSRGMWDKAIESYRRELELQPDSAETLTSLGACYLRKQLPTEAESSLKAALAIEPNSAETLHQLGNAYALMSNWSKAIDAFKKALRIRPSYVEVYNNLGFAYMRAGTIDQAVAAFKTALEHRPDYYQACFNLGNLYLEQQDFAKAIKYYRETVRLDPKFVPALYNLGRAYYEKHDLDEAIHCYQKAVALNPKHFGAWHNLGIAYRDKGQTQKAVEALEKAVTINPNLMR
jgi:tetratricopeptide (TPR) repeat protein